MRVLWVEIETVHASLEQKLQITMARSSEDGHCSDAIAMNHIPVVVGCICEIDDQQQGTGGCGRSERLFLLLPGNRLRIDEDFGESIARHIW